VSSHVGASAGDAWNTRKQRATPERFARVFDQLERMIEERWEIPVRIRDVPDPFTGDLDGAEIQVDYDLTAEDALFILVHLFGHTVQWNTCDQARAIGFYQGPWDPASLAAVRDYEARACCYSMQLFHEAGITDLDQWLSDFAACDYAYLEHFYKTGEKQPFQRFWHDDQPLLQAAPIPEFSPRQWVSRNGTVV